MKATSICIAAAIWVGCGEPQRSEAVKHDDAGEDAAYDAMDGGSVDAADDTAHDAAVDADDAAADVDESEGTEAGPATDGGFCVKDEDCPRPPSYPMVLAEHGRCVDNRCGDCDPDTNEPCGRGTPYTFRSPICTRFAGEPTRCLACATDEQCTRVGKGPLCRNGGQCTNCDDSLSFEASGCDITSGRPVCIRAYQIGGGPISCGACMSNHGAPDLYPCGASRPVCLGEGSPKRGYCVVCAADSDCKDASKPRCDTVSNECIP